MVEGPAARVAAVLAHKSRVVVPDTGVDVGNDDALAAVGEGRPDKRGADPINAPLDGIDSRLGLSADRLRDAENVGGDDPLDFRPACQHVEQGLVAGHANRVQDPERLVVRATPREQRAEASLASIRRLAELAVDELSA